MHVHTYLEWLHQMLPHNVIQEKWMTRHHWTHSFRHAIRDDQETNRPFNWSKVDNLGVGRWGFVLEQGIDRLLSWMLSVSCVVDLLHHFLLLFPTIGLTTPTKNWGRASFTSHTPTWCGLWDRLVPKLPHPYILSLVFCECLHLFLFAIVFYMLKIMPMGNKRVSPNWTVHG